MAESITTKNITSVDEVQSVDNTDKVFVNDNGSFKQISVSNLMKQAPSGVTEETDPTVSEWAKQPTKPSYTADEVGALPVGTKIPTKTSDLTNDSGFITNSDIPEKLPNPQKLIFSGAVTGEYDGSSQQTINIPTDGGSEPYTLPIMSSTQLGGGKAVEKTDEDVPVAVDPLTGQLFVPTYPENTGGGGGTVDPEQIKQAVNGYLEENPVSGMTAEQEQQLNQNTTDVADLKSALPQKIDKNQGKDNANKYLKTDSDGNVSLASFTLYSENGTEYELVVSDDGVLAVKKKIHDINNVKILDIDMTNWNEKEYVTDLVSETKFDVNKEEKNIVPSVKYYSSYDLMKDTLLEKGFTIFYSYDLRISDSNIQIYQYSGMTKSYSNLDGNWKYYLTWFSQYFTANITQNDVITQWNIYPFPTDPQINTCIMSYKDTTVTVYFNGDKVGEFNCGSIENAIRRLFNGMPTTSNGEAVTHYTIYEGTVTDERAKQITDFFF